jgi:hypothetical protein
VTNKVSRYVSFGTHRVFRGTSVSAHTVLTEDMRRETGASLNDSPYMSLTGESSAGTGLGKNRDQGDIHSGVPVTEKGD